MKKLLLTALFASFAAFGMQQGESKITVNSIINKTDKNWLFLNGLTIQENGDSEWAEKVKIPANQTIQINQTLTKPKGPPQFERFLKNFASTELQLEPMPQQGFARYLLRLSQDGKIEYGTQNKEGTFAINFSSGIKVAKNINIITRLETERGTGEYFVLDFEPASITAPSLLTLGAQKVAQIIQTGKLSLEEAKKKTPREVYERVLALIPADEIKKIQAKELQNKALELVALLMKDPANEAAVKAKIKGLDLETLIAINDILANQTAINRVQTLLQQEIQEKVSE